MRIFFKNRKDSRFKDRADSVLTTVILAVPLIALLSGLTIDVSKNIYLKNLYTQQAQSAAEAAVKSIDARGSLGKSAIKKFKDEFELQSASKANSKTGKNVATAENESYESESCQKVEIDGKERKLPYIEVTLSTGRGKSGTEIKNKAIIEGGKITRDIQPGKAKYKVIKVDAYTASNNIMLGSAGSMFGYDKLHCQVYKSSVSAIAFGSNEDL